jgi:NAD(P)-dependent dehydrogenase (short-subunit alcohol dehydrogenase family)
MLTVRQLSRLWKADHISVNAAYPGVTSTNFKRHLGVDKSISGKGKMLQGSVVDQCHFGIDRDLDPVPRIRTTDLRTLLFLSVTFKMPCFFAYFSLKGLHQS